MKELKLSSKYDNYIGTLYNGERLYSADVVLYSSDLDYLTELHMEYFYKMDRMERIESIKGSTCIVNILGWIEDIDREQITRNKSDSDFPECEYKFRCKIIYVKEPSNYNLRGVQMGYFDLLSKQKEDKE